MLDKKTKEWINKCISSLETPIYLYNRELIKNFCNHFKNIKYKNTSIHFATMANCNPEFLKTIKDLGLNVFVNSLMHLEKVKKAGFKEKEIIFTASSISKKVMHKIHDENIYVNLDSVSQLEYWFQKYPNQPVGIRCNIENKAYEAKSSRAGVFIGEKSRLGLNLGEIKSIKNKELIQGLHIYVGTDITDIEYFISFYKTLIDLANEFPNIEYLDFGGGFGIIDIDENIFNFEKYGQIVTEMMNSFSLTRNKDIKLILEPGRMIGGPSAYFICEVTDIKNRGGIQFIGVNASSTQFPRPLLYPKESSHPITVLNKNAHSKKGNKIKSKVSGCSTYSKDYLSHDIDLPHAEIGDYLIIENAGAYCASMHTTFLGFEKAKEIFI